ncbi:MAG TPA: 4Fe-4S dicluster domain-containing protein [bacterium]|nr:4Fe-4S dicluster domain-containing protein [bacterium]
MRKVIEIDEDKCNGCAACTKVCAEAAITMVDGKARVVGDFLCDGMGACLDVCPVDALHIVERETDAYDPQRAYEHVKQERGVEAAQHIHGVEQVEAACVDEKQVAGGVMKCGCPGTMMRDFSQDASVANCQCEGGTAKSQLRQWPIQLHLLQPQAPYFANAELVIAADCVPFAYAGFHDRFLKGKTLIMFCPKLDHSQDEYVAKLAEIFKTQNIRSVTIVHMEVPCCSGVEHIVRGAMEQAGVNITLKDYTISLRGEIV